jgi:hypothetical protein
MNRSPFSHRPDLKLGRAIGQVLTGKNRRAFVDRVMAEARLQIERQTESSSWDVLGAWARPGLVAALLLIVAVLFGARETAPSTDEVTLDDAFSQTAEGREETSLLLSPSPPDADVVLAVVYEP